MLISKKMSSHSSVNENLLMRRWNILMGVRRTDGFYKVIRDYKEVGNRCFN